ncbi:MAG: acetylxylan esterase [Verrucomicrobia bacterium]|nr:acetylxylan esterase [Verrucomicrobiota bacterium]
MVCPAQSALSAEGKASPVENRVAVKDLDTRREFPTILSQLEWQARAKEIREHILVSCGLWPLPERTPLQAHIFGKIERGGYSVEKVYFQPLPGFYLAGNLYRPLGRGKGPFPAILNPHGHWNEGRLADNKDGSIAARCISFARQGMIAFSYDMVGYNDTFFADPDKGPAPDHSGQHRQFATNRANLLWNVSLMGLQTWDSIRALDFLESLPDVDRKRLACTGESGGGTQTFMLGAVDDRLAAQAPVVMVSHTMQGGCLCENAPGLRVEYSNMEFAAAAAPRPQILVAATGDWTKDTLTVEGPAIERIYQFLNAKDSFRYVRFDFGHNYNQTSREAVYDWFGKFLLKDANAAWLKEEPYQKEPDADLRVFPDGKLPEGAVSEARLIESIKSLHRACWESSLVHDKGEVEQFKKFMQPAWRHTLQVEPACATLRSRAESVTKVGEYTAATLTISRSQGGPTLRASYWAPPGIITNAAAKVVVICHDTDASALPDAGAEPAGLPLALLQRGLAVLTVDRFSVGDPPDQFANFYTTYNRTKLQERVRDLMTVCAAAGSLAELPELHEPRFTKVILLGTGRAGLWALLAAPAAGAVVADCSHLDVASDAALLAPDFFCPGIRNIGAFEGVAMLAAPHPLLLHDTEETFPTDALRAIYRAMGASDKLRVVASRLPDEELVQWVLQANP